MPESTVLATRDGNVVTLTLNRPAVLNSLCLALHGDLMRALDDIERDPDVRCVVLTGAGRGFCAGQDLGEPGVIGATDAGAVLETHYNAMILRLRALPLPVVGAINGVAAGAGASLALACDIVLAARSARFIQAFVRIGWCRTAAARGCCRGSSATRGRARSRSRVMRSGPSRRRNGD